MRKAICFVALLLVAGCGTFNGMFDRPKHFPLGSVKEEESAKSLKHSYSDVQQILRERNYSIKKCEMGEEAAQIVAEKEGSRMIIDITSIGEGSKIHIEINQAGNNGELFGVLTDLKAYP